MLAYSVFQWAGVTPREWNITLIALFPVSIFTWFRRSPPDLAPALSPASTVLMAAVLAYAALQLLPLPAGWISILSPARYEILRGLAPIHTQSWAPLSVSPRLTFAHLLRLLAYLVVFFLARQFAFRLARRVWVCAVPLLLIASIESAIGLVQHFETGGFALGTYANHGHLAGLLEMTLPPALILILIAFDRERKEGGESVAIAAIICLLLACAALILAGLLYTSSRMGLAAAAISMVVMGGLELASRRKRSTIVLFAAAAALLILLLAAPLSLVSRYEGGLTAEVRLQIWRDSLKLIAHYPVFGCGLGTFVSAVQKYRGATPLALVDYAHNDYLQLLAELGAVGFVLAMAFAGVILRDIYRAIRGKRNAAPRLMATACAASLAAIAAHSLVDFQFYIPANVMVAAWIAGLAQGIEAPSGRSVSMDSA